MGVVPKAETNRDKRLIHDYLKKTKKGRWAYSLIEIGLKYARTDGTKTIPLTRTRIHQILNKNGIDKKRVVKVKKSARKRSVKILDKR